MAQRVMYQITQMLATDCIPRFLTDGFKEHRIAILVHFGSWIHPECRQATGPMPKPR
jgi:hypothetical protein